MSSAIKGVIFIAISCFLLGFVYQVIFVNNHRTSTQLLRHNSPDAVAAPSVVQPKILDQLKPAVYEQYNGPSAHSGHVPHLVQVWRKGLIDWHDLIPQHNSAWERFGTPQKEGKLRLLVSKEEQLTDFLTQYHTSGLSGRFGHNHGALSDYVGCDAISDPCLIHDYGICRTNQMCSWSNDAGLCLAKPLLEYQSPPEKCTEVRTVESNNVMHVAHPETTCRNYITQLALHVNLDGESQSMFYHWWASFSSLLSRWQSDLAAVRQMHIIIKQDPMFFHFFGVMSDFCWRRNSEQQIPVDTCYCNLTPIAAPQTRMGVEHAVEYVKKFFELPPAAMSPNPQRRPKVGLISRRKKRFILNEFDLIAAANDAGFDAELLPLEHMTVLEQLTVLQSVDILVGMHGSGLDNSVFLRPGAVLLQLLPYKVEHRASFQTSAEFAGVHYMEWQSTNPALSVFHWDLLEQANANALKRYSKEEYLERGQLAVDMRETIMFWINQDIIVPIDEWIRMLQKAAERVSIGQ